MAWSLATTGAGHLGVLQPPAPARPTPCSRQCGYGTANRRLKLGSSSVLCLWWSWFSTTRRHHVGAQLSLGRRTPLIVLFFCLIYIYSCFKYSRCVTDLNYELFICKRRSAPVFPRKPNTKLILISFTYHQFY